MIGPKTIDQVREDIALQMVTSFIEAPANERPALRADSFQVAQRLFIGSGLDGHVDLREFTDTIDVAVNAMDGFSFENAFKQIYQVRLNRGEDIL